MPDAKLIEIAYRTGELDEPASDNTDYNVPFYRAAPELQELFKARKDVAVHMNVFSLGFPNNPLYGDKGRLEQAIADLRRRKESIEKNEYENQLEELLVDLAMTNRAIRERGES